VRRTKTGRIALAKRCAKNAVEKTSQTERIILAKSPASNEHFAGRARVCAAHFVLQGDS
jgi:hypothetical protein